MACVPFSQQGTCEHCYVSALVEKELDVSLPWASHVIPAARKFLKRRAVELVKKTQSPKKPRSGFSQAPYGEVPRAAASARRGAPGAAASGSKDTAPEFSVAMDAKAEKQIEKDMKRESRKWEHFETKRRKKW